jgi:hypothetical protein
MGMCSSAGIPSAGGHQGKLEAKKRFPVSGHPVNRRSARPVIKTFGKTDVRFYQVFYGPRNIGHMEVMNLPPRLTIS